MTQAHRAIRRLPEALRLRAARVLDPRRQVAHGALTLATPA